MDIHSALQIAITCAKKMWFALKKLTELKKSFNKLQQSLPNLNVESLDLKQENKELLRQLQLKNELQLDNDSKVYWRITSEKKEGPFCSTCYGAESKLIPLHYNGEESWYCSKCKANFQTKKKWQEQRRKCLGLDPQ